MRLPKVRRPSSPASVGGRRSSAPNSVKHVAPPPAPSPHRGERALGCVPRRNKTPDQQLRATRIGYVPGVFAHFAGDQVGVVLIIIVVVVHVRPHLLRAVRGVRVDGRARAL